MADYEVAAAAYDSGGGGYYPKENGSSYDEREFREASRERELNRDRYSREKSRERSKEREGGRDRRHRDDKERYDRDWDRSERHRGHRDSDRRHRHRRSHSNSRGKSRDRSQSRSRSGSEDRRGKRASGFDVPPPGAAAGQPTPAAVAPQFPSSMLPQMTQQATRHARQVYVGGLPSMVNEQSIASFFNQVMVSIGGNTAGVGDVVVNVYINQEKKFAFVEMRTVEEASNAMALDGIVFQGVSVRVRRPSDYNPSVAANLGPSQPNPNLNLAAVGLVPGALGGVDGPDRIFVGGLPYYLTEPQIKELLESFGPLRGFDLVKDRDTGNSKGYGFCVYQDPSVTDVACAALNGLKMGDRTLTVRRATANGQQNQDQAQMLRAMTAMTMLPPGLLEEPPTRVLCLKEAIREEELQNDEAFEEILEDMREECGKFGVVASVVIPRPSPTQEEVAGVGKVFVQFQDQSATFRARAALNGRKFDGRPVVATYYSEERFQAGDFSV